MRDVNYISWEENGACVGYLQDFPEYRAFGSTLNDLEFKLVKLYGELSGKKVLDFVSWQEDGIWFGYLVDFPSSVIRGTSRRKLEQGLADLYHKIARIRRRFDAGETIPVNVPGDYGCVVFGM